MAFDGNCAAQFLVEIPQLITCNSTQSLSNNTKKTGFLYGEQWRSARDFREKTRFLGKTSQKMIKFYLRVI